MGAANPERSRGSPSARDFIQSGEIAQRISEDKRRLAGGPAERGHLITFDPRDAPQVVHAIDPQWRQDVICGAALDEMRWGAALILPS